jgi:sigma-E factor negative regulatory protein RseB
MIAPAGRRGWVRHAGVGVLGLWLAASGAAQPLPIAAAAVGVTPQPLHEAEVRRWFARIHVAAQSLNYQGTLVSSADGVLSSARVAHFHDGHGSFERVEVLDGRRQRTYRHNDQVTTLWPQQRVAVVEQRESRLASLRQVLEPRAGQHYRVFEQGTGHVAGREAMLLLLRPTDDLRFGQRLWVDAQTALVLRTDVLGPRDQVLESSAFSQVEIGMKAKPASVLQPMRQLDGWQRVLPAQVPTRLDAEGWTLSDPVPGFELTGCARRSLGPAAGRVDESAVMQAVYSDGLTHVSLFFEPIGERRARGPMQAQNGATHTLMQPIGGDWWVTAVGDVPSATLRRFLQALQRKN